MTILAIDHGQKRIGLAISDEMEIIADILPLYNGRTTFFISDYMPQLLTKYHIDKILLGIPYGTNRSITPQTKIVLSFKQALQRVTKLPIIDWDESYTSVIVDRNLRGKEKTNSDSQVARQMLLDYLAFLAEMKITTD